MPQVSQQTTSCGTDLISFTGSSQLDLAIPTAINQRPPYNYTMIAHSRLIYSMFYLRDSNACILSALIMSHSSSFLSEHIGTPHRATSMTCRQCHTRPRGSSRSNAASMCGTCWKLKDRRLYRLLKLNIMLGESAKGSLPDPVWSTPSSLPVFEEYGKVDVPFPRRRLQRRQTRQFQTPDQLPIP